MCVGGPECFQRMRGPILGQFDQHLVRRHLRDGRGNRLVREAIDAGPEGTLRTGTADRIVDPLLVRATDNPVVADGVLDSLTAQPLRQFGGNHRIMPDVDGVGAPAAHRMRRLLSGATQDADHEFRRSPVVGSVGRDCR